MVVLRSRRFDGLLDAVTTVDECLSRSATRTFFFFFFFSFITQTDFSAVTGPRTNPIITPQETKHSVKGKVTVVLTDRYV